MSEIRLNLILTQLLDALCSSVPVDEIITILINDIKSKSNTALYSHTNHVQDLAQSCSDSKEFIQKYDELIANRTLNAESFIELLYYINKDQALKKLLKRAGERLTLQNCPSRLMKSPSNGKSMEILPDLKHKIYEAVTNEKLLSCTQLVDAKKSSSINWLQKRFSMSWDFDSENNPQTTVIIAPIPLASQESLLIEDLFYVLTGIGGVIIDPLPVKNIYEPRKFNIRSDIDPSLSRLVSLILPAASHFSILQRFTEEKVIFECGQVNHALAAAISSLIKDYLLFVCQLEAEYKSSGNLTLQKMWFYIQSNIYVMGVIAEIAADIGKSNAKGGKVLSLLHRHTAEHLSNPKIYDLCLFLTQRAAKPYMLMLGSWIYKGIINDPFKEFLVEDNQLARRVVEPDNDGDNFWEKGYSVKQDRVPCFLEKVADIILRTGKYLNVIRQCGKTITADVEEIVYDSKKMFFVEKIEKAYLSASTMLRTLLMDEYDLLGRLSSVKHYFLLDQGDFIVQFMDLCEKELSKNIEHVILPRVASLFELALRISCANNDSYKDDLRIKLLQNDLQSQMFKILSIDSPVIQEKLNFTGLESFSFEYEVRWPISLVLNRRAIACYQMIFRNLFFCKHVERLLCRVWISNKDAKLYKPVEAQQYRNAFTLRQRMLNCIQNLEYHMMVEAIEPNWQTFKERVTKVVDVDKVLKCHNDFLDMCLKDCMLTDPVLLSIVTKLLNICMEFCSFMQLMQRYIMDAELNSSVNSAHDVSELLLHHQQSSQHSLTSSMYNSMSNSMFNTELAEIDVNESETFEKSIERFDCEFNCSLYTLMEKINDLGRKKTNDKLVNLLYRIDFNSFYSTQWENMSKLHNMGDVSG